MQATSTCTLHRRSDLICHHGLSGERQIHASTGSPRKKKGDLPANEQIMSADQEEEEEQAV